jgi:hypothetical protein
MKIQLNVSEQNITKELSQKRYENNRAENIENKKIGRQSNYETDLDGFGAELAVAKYLNIYPDFTIEPRNGGIDLTLKSGCTIDVKQTRYNNGKLIATMKKEKDKNVADIFVLVTGIFPAYDIVGWCKKNELINQNNVIDLGYGNTYGLNQDKLRKKFI